MQILFSDALKYSNSKKEILSNLLSQRVILLIGKRKAAHINNIYFLDDIPLTLSNSSESSTVPAGVISSWIDGKMEIYCHSNLLKKLLHQGNGYLIFDRAIIATTSSIHIN